MIVLGVNAYHGDAAACLLRDGELVAAAEEERFRRIKHWAGFPSQAIRYCLQEAGAGLSEVDVLAVNQDARAHLWRKLGFLVTRRPDLGLVLDRLRNKREREAVPEVLAREVGRGFAGRVEYVEHHVAHLLSAYAASPFQTAVAVSVDGFGDFASAAWGLGAEGRVEAEGRIYFPHSLGVFYQALTQFLGFPDYGDEYKVMGLAPYGAPRYLEALRRVLRLQDDGGFTLDLAYFRHASEKVPYEWDGGSPSVGTLYSPALVELLGPPRKPGEALTPAHRDLARSIQAMYEEAFFHLLRALQDRYGEEALCLSGGCAMNSVANGKVYAQTPFRRLYVQPAAGDAGGAIGAAIGGSLSCGVGRRTRMTHAAWGPSFPAPDIEAVLQRSAEPLRAGACRVERVEDEAILLRETAAALAGGEVVGWFQGRMEWGPRALGNRSILGDPRRADMKELLNAKIKRRESFRPFAPSVLREEVAAWFETDDDVPFMMQVYAIREAQRARIPAVTHVDGTGRLQTVTPESNPRYYALICAFRDLTGVPMVLNTSFNENEPIVCRPEEALDCFLRTRMDRLVLGDWVVIRGR